MQAARAKFEEVSVHGDFGALTERRNGMEIYNHINPERLLFDEQV